MKLRYLLQSSVYVANPCAAVLCSNEGRELSRLLACAWCICSARYKNLPVLFLLFYFYTYVFTLCHLEIKAGVCSSAAKELCLLRICCFAQIKHLWGRRLLTAPSQVFQPPTVWWFFCLCTLTQLLQKNAAKLSSIGLSPFQAIFPLCVQFVFSLTVSYEEQLSV